MGNAHLCVSPYMELTIITCHIWTYLEIPECVMRCQVNAIPYGDLGDDPVISMYGYPGFDEVSVAIFIYGDPVD